MDRRRSRRMKRTNSDEALSSMTGDVDARGQICPAQFQDQSVVWTDEKHNLYIESLEATFVQQLHQSIGFIDRNTHYSSDKFTLHQDGCRKILKPSGNLQMDTANNEIREKPRVRNFGSSGKNGRGSSLSSGMDYGHIGKKTIFRPRQLAGHFGGYHLSSSDAADLAEVSDQNFTDEKQG